LHFIARSDAIADCWKIPKRRARVAELWIVGKIYSMVDPRTYDPPGPQHATHGATVFEPEKHAHAFLCLSGQFIARREQPCVCGRGRIMGKGNAAGSKTNAGHTDLIRFEVSSRMWTVFAGLLLRPIADLSMIDIGSGNGAASAKAYTNLGMHGGLQGYDVLVHKSTPGAMLQHVKLFDGVHIPETNASFDVISFTYSPSPKGWYHFYFAYHALLPLCPELAIGCL
jgi:hypothetical protein